MTAKEVFDIISLAFRSRLLFPDEEGFQRCVGVSFDTVTANRENPSRLMSYYRLLDDRCLDETGFNLDTILHYYVNASSISRAEGLDWGQRHQLASRKRFLRRLFRLSFAPDIPLSAEETGKFRPKDDDPRLLRLFYPEGIGGGRSVDLVFLLLITFGVVKPIHSGMTRSLLCSPEDMRTSIDRMIRLVKTLREDCPPVGILQTPLIFDFALDRLYKKFYELEEGATSAVSTAWLWNILNEIEDELMRVASPQRYSSSDLKVTGLSMPGIWVDDHDRGKSRFWVFPQNKHMAFCYSRRQGRWSLTPYEFCFYRNNDGVWAPYCGVATARGNNRVIERECDKVPDSELASVDFKTEDIDEGGNFHRLSFLSDGGKFPGWFDWRSFRRLPDTGLDFRRFKEALEEIYEPGSFQGARFVNEGWRFTDVVNALVGIDGDYLYVSDFVARANFRLTYEIEDGMGYFWYDGESIGKPSGRNLLTIEISERQPLYAIPRPEAIPDSLSGEERLLAEASSATKPGDQITVYTATDGRKQLCFNSLGAIFPLERILTFPGVRRLTSRPL